MTYRVVSLDTPNEVLWARSNERDLDRIMREKPAILAEASKVVRTANGNLVVRR